MDGFLAAALRITEQASAIPKRYFRTGVDVDQKRDESPVTIADRETERAIRDALKSEFPDHAIFGEEFGREETGSRFEWIIDPIDGTKAFISGMPLYGMLLALLDSGKIKLGLVRMPELNEVYVGHDGQATRDGSVPLRVSEVADLKDAFLYINGGERIMALNPALFTRLCAAGRMRRFSYDCYPYMLLACGHVDAVVDIGLQPYDYMPLLPIIEGAGGVISDWHGRDLTMDSDGTILSAATKSLHRQLRAWINVNPSS